MPEALLEARNLTKYFPVSTGGVFGRVRGYVKAVDGVSFSVYSGETLGVVGESGCGKTTTSKLVLTQEAPTSGSLIFKGQDVSKLKGKGLKEYRQSVQVVFQDPFSSLSPRMRVGDIIAEPLEVHSLMSQQGIKHRVNEVLELVGLQAEVARLFPHEFSGGQRQRVAIARALATNAELIVLDEPVSALDVSIRAHILTSAGGTATGIGRKLRLHRPRPGRRCPHQSPHRSYVPGQDCRNRGKSGVEQQSPAPLYPGSICCGIAFTS